MDFTLEVYKKLLFFFLKYNYVIITYSDFLKRKKNEHTVILRHDVDRKPNKALRMAQIENEIGIKASYYFRIVRETFDDNIIKKIVKLDHEIGYHYEDLALAKGNYRKAIKTFKENLKKLGKFYPIKTICMHGSPLSKWDNRLIWEKYNYKDLGIIGDPYFDLDFNKLLYITDASRKLNNEKVTVRDKVKSKYNYKFKSTLDIINSIKKLELPLQIMINIHPHNWSCNFFDWLKIIIWQNIKNVIKSTYIALNKS